MKYEHHDPKAGAPDGPTRDAILTQIEADHQAAKGDRKAQAVLNERHRVVSAATTDEQAREAYSRSLDEAVEAEKQEAARESAAASKAIAEALADQEAASAAPEEE